MQLKELELKANAIRKRALRMIFEAKTGHLGGTMSMTDILVALYYYKMNVDPKQPNKYDRDRFVLSKGHSVETLYCVLADMGFFPKDELNSYSSFGSRLFGHPTVKVPGVEACSGALGHGAPVAVGMAIGARKSGLDSMVYFIMGDGEQAEGSVWEAAMAAANYKLDNLVGILDRNMLQITGCTEYVMALESLTDKWRAFGWCVKEIDGNNMRQVVEALDALPFEKNKPSLIIAHTVKGKGICFAENNHKWHHSVPSREQYKVAMMELERQMQEMTDHGK
jgi:transketolase